MLTMFSCTTFCQVKERNGVKGTVKDSIANKLVNKALICLIRSKDSIFVSYGYSDSFGRYYFENLLPDNYKIIISFRGFADYTEDIVLKNSESLDLGIQFLTSKYKILEEVIVRQRKSAMSIKNDTLQFLADSFQVRTNATIEDLLKSLPGVSVNKDGQIKVHGQRVNQVFVDGEEFFGNDPTIVTQNLPAKIVDKVQVYDKKSEISKITGMDDGKTVKVINVKLKENSKKGYFGKLVLGGNFYKNWNNSLMINSFKNKRQLSVFAMTSNIGRTLIDRSDQSKYGFRLNDGAGKGISSLRDTYYDVGIPNSSGGGVHYANKWSEERLGFNSNITGSSLGNKGVQTNSTQLFIKDSVLLSSEKYLIDNSRTEYSWDGKFNAKLDSTSTLSTTVKVRYGRLVANNSLHYQIEDLTHPINKSQQSNDAVSTYDNYSGNIEWRKKINSRGRNISAVVNYDYLSSQTEGDLKAISQFYLNDGSLQKGDTINYKRNNSSNDNTLESKLIYTEPIFKKSFLSINYGFSASDFAADWSSLDNTTPGSEPIDSLSSEYNYLILSHEGGITFRIPQNKFNFTLGQNMAITRYDQKDMLTKKSNRYSFLNLLPNASVSYTFVPLTSLRVSYNGFNTPPTIRQIQPVTDNTNSVVLYKGNSDLRQAFNNTYTIVYNSLKLVKKRKLYSSISLITVKNAIGYNEYIGTDGKRIIQPVNTRSSGRVFGYINYTFELKKLKVNWTNDVTFLRNRDINFINGFENQTKSNTYSYTTSISKNTKNLSLDINASVAYNFINYSSPDFSDVKFWSGNSYISFIGDLPEKFELGSKCVFSFQQRSPFFSKPNSIIQWNAHIGKRVFKKANGVFQLSANNILNQNNGYSRLVSGNYISEQLTETLGRYWLLSFTLNFNNQDKK